jgi:hypothetical protein
MRSIRTGIALVQAVAMAAVLIVWCPCPAPASTAAADPHACCHQNTTVVRAALDPCCAQCGIAKAPTSAEPAAPSTTLDAPAPSSAAAVAHGLTTDAARLSSGLPTVSPPLLSAPTPLRI